MKLSAIWSLLKQRKRVVVHKGEDAQWVGDGYASYPIYSLPELNEENIRILLDVKEDAWDKFTCGFYPDVPFAEFDNGLCDRELQPLGISIFFRGKALLPLTDGHTLYYIEEKYLKPFNDFGPLFSYRPHGGFDEGIILLKEGMLLRGVAAPYYPNELEGQELMEALRKVYFQTDTMLKEHIKPEQVGNADDQLSFEEDEE